MSDELQYRVGGEWRRRGERRGEETTDKNDGFRHADCHLWMRSRQSWGTERKLPEQVGRKEFQCHRT
eukprot:765128-Hanusia_phi.AAC.5